MFYSHTYLKRKGRFGLVWLAATQSKVLNKRELYAINISMTCSDILNHIPGYLSKEVAQRPHRFSLYLSAQLMYGSAKVLQKQWEYLFVDVSTLLRRFHPDMSSDIDLILLKQDPVTIASCIPASKEYDPFFGSFKESTVDVEAYLDIWDNNYLSKCALSPTAKSDLESYVSSVSNPLDIQIRDSHVMPIETMLPGEQDLPDLDLENLELLDQSGNITLSQEGLINTQISRSPDATEVAQTHEPSYHHPPLEETPAVKTSSDVPRTPQKRKRRNDVPDERRAKHKAVEQDEALAGTSDILREEQTPVVIATSTPFVSTGLLLHHGHDWLQQQPLIELSPFTPSPSSARRRKFRKLVIDQTINMSREDMQHNMLTSDSTSQTLILPNVHQTDCMKGPGSRSLKTPALVKLWSRNCKFGLRIYDTETESSPSADSIISSQPKVQARRRTLSLIDETRTPVEGISIQEPLTVSLEHQRAASAESASYEGNESRSIIAQINESRTSLSTSKRRASTDSEPSGHQGMSFDLLDQSRDLRAVPEEPEVMISPVPPELVPDKRAVSEHVDEAPFTTLLQEGDSPGKLILRLVTQSLRTAHDWTTFRTICPPLSFERIKAARLFMALCSQVRRKKLCVRQDEPFSDIFIWLPAGVPE